MVALMDRFAIAYGLRIPSETYNNNTVCIDCGLTPKPFPNKTS